MAARLSWRGLADRTIRQEGGEIAMVDYVYYYTIKKDGVIVFQGYARELYSFLRFDPKGETVTVRKFQIAAREQLAKIGYELTWEKRPRGKRYQLDLSHLL
jgi:hypothetical protein